MSETPFVPADWSLVMRIRLSFYPLLAEGLAVSTVALAQESVELRHYEKTLFEHDVQPTPRPLPRIYEACNQQVSSKRLS